MGMHLYIVEKLIKSDNQRPILVNKTGRNLLKEGQKKINTSQKDERKEKGRSSLQNTKELLEVALSEMIVLCVC